MSESSVSMALCVFLRRLADVKSVMCLSDLVLCSFEHTNRTVWYDAKLSFYYFVLSSCRFIDMRLYSLFSWAPCRYKFYCAWILRFSPDKISSTSQVSCYWEPSEDLLSVLVSGFFIRGWVWKPDCNWRIQRSEAFMTSGGMMNGVTSQGADEPSGSWCFELGHLSNRWTPK